MADDKVFVHLQPCPAASYVKSLEFNREDAPFLCCINLNPLHSVHTIPTRQSPSHNESPVACERANIRTPRTSANTARLSMEHILCAPAAASLKYTTVYPSKDHWNLRGRARRATVRRVLKLAQGSNCWRIICLHLHLVCVTNLADGTLDTLLGAYSRNKK